MKKNIYIHVSTNGRLLGVFTNKKQSRRHLIRTGNLTVYTYEKVGKISYKFSFCPSCGVKFYNLKCKECGFEVDKIPF